MHGGDDYHISCSVASMCWACQAGLKGMQSAAKMRMNLLHVSHAMSMHYLYFLDTAAPMLENVRLDGKQSQIHASQLANLCLPLQQGGPLQI